MYASNEDEFDREHADWVFLRQAAQVDTGAVNLLDHERTISSPSSSSSSTDSDSSTSKRSGSLSSVSSADDERIQHGDHNVEAANQSLVEDPVLASQAGDERSHVPVEDEIKEQGVSSEIPIQSVSNIETSPVINEYELPNGACDSSADIVVSWNHVCRRPGANVHHTDEQHPSTVEHQRRFVRPPNRPSEGNYRLIVYVLLALLVALPLIFCRFVTSQRLVLDQMTENLQQANQRLDQIKNVSIADLEQKLTEQLEAKFHEILKQRMAEHDQEKYSLVLQINELYHTIHTTQQNFTNTMHRLFMENVQLQQQVEALEARQHASETQRSKTEERHFEGADFNQSSASPLEVLIGNVFKQTAAIAEDTSVNLSGFFEQLSASLSELVDHRHTYVEESKRKLNDFAGSKTAEKVQKTIRRSVDNLSSSLHKAHSNYATWIRSRAQQREQARMDSTEHGKTDKSARRPWRWTFQRGQEREQMRHQDTPTQRHWSNKEHVCHSDYEFPVNQLCSMKNWMERFFRP